MKTALARLQHSGNLQLLINAVGFQCCWAACVIGGNAWAIVIVPLFFMWHWTQLKPNEIKLIAIVTLFGVLYDSTLLKLGLFNFPEYTGFIIPLWLIFLWATFAATLLHSMAWLLTKPWLATLLGAIAAPWSYYAGSLLKSIELTSPVLIIIALVWGALLACISVWHKAFQKIDIKDFKRIQS